MSKFHVTKELDHLNAYVWVVWESFVEDDGKKHVCLRVVDCPLKEAAEHICKSLNNSAEVM